VFIGHFAVGFAAKAVAPRASLGTLFLAAQFIDLLWPTLLLLGVERVQIAPGITRAGYATCFGHCYAGATARISFDVTSIAGAHIDWGTGQRSG
jgi:hypothetical protein